MPIFYLKQLKLVHTW